MGSYSWGRIRNRRGSRSRPDPNVTLILEGKMSLNLEKLDDLEAPLSSDFWIGFGIGAGTVLAAAGVIATIVGIT